MPEQQLALLVIQTMPPEDVGYVDGFFDRHSVEHEFSSGVEWTAWLKGWRVGQIELKRQHASAEQMRRGLAHEMPSNADFAPRLVTNHSTSESSGS
jgi:hypothetical protein